jgi:hypothetical protein
MITFNYFSRWKRPNDIVYFDEETSRPFATRPNVLQLKRSSAPFIDDVPPPKRVFSGSSSAAGVGSEAIASTVFD